ncbi:type IV pilus biogenesis/stability protein PilW [Marinagarivorans algicola]|uniref:type IV pilus biogenesis/stability protein PilW n=1 Tax=Marinagarivorans algicola TaxID=1513270 RepID=UPI0006B6149C|nr:type IV pilus biogenesis/stability protein PilW [Marinagarivorans algicola]
MHKIVLAMFVFFLAACVSTGGVHQVDADPRKALDTRIELGMKYLDTGNRDQALRQFLEVLDIDRKNPEALKGLALVHQMNGEIAEAEAAFKKSIRYADDSMISSAEFKYGLFLSRQQRYKEAMEQFESVATNLVFPQRAESLYFVGRCALALGNKVRAKAAFTHSLNLRKNSASPALELADLAYQEQDYSMAKKYLDRFNRYSEPSARSLWLGIRIDRTFGHKDKMASQAMALKNLFGYSREYLQYKQLIENN